MGTKHSDLEKGCAVKEKPGEFHVYPSQTVNLFSSLSGQAQALMPFNVLMASPSSTARLTVLLLILL